MAKDIQAMSPLEMVDRIRELQEKESDMYDQIEEVNDFFQGFLKELEEKFKGVATLSFFEIAEYSNLKERLHELEEKFKEVATLNFFEIAEYSNLKERLQEMKEAGILSDSEIKEFGELILVAEKNQTEAQKWCEDLGMIAKKITHMSVKLKNELLFAQKNQ